VRAREKEKEIVCDPKMKMKRAYLSMMREEVMEDDRPQVRIKHQTVQQENDTNEGYIHLFL